MMKKQSYNPYLPLSTYIPDGEPHVFNGRIYIFGSHDKEGGDTFCMLDYEVWSAPVDDPGNWTCHGISYRAAQDPSHNERYKYMYAPDVVKGNDGRYYLYYAMAGGVFTGPIHVAVSEHPEGPYNYYGEVRTPDGKVFERNITFDPGVINDDGTIRLYYGWALASPQTAGISRAKRNLLSPMLHALEMKMFDKTKEQIKREKDGLQGAFTVELGNDMLTVLTEPKKILPGQLDATETEFAGHAFFEASSIRKIAETYYFIYSSEVNHELCYATSRYPDRDFSYGGVIISNGDIGMNGRKEEDRLAITGNNHGSIECINGKWYIFYHRHTHKTCYSRQGCAEMIEITPEGRIAQVEMTSCGLNGKALSAEGIYPAAICCNLTNGRMPHISQDGIQEDIPYITEEDNGQFVAGITKDTKVVYKYFDFMGKTYLRIRYRLSGNGSFLVFLDDVIKGELLLRSDSEWKETQISFEAEGKHVFTLLFNGDGRAELLEFEFSLENIS